MKHLITLFFLFPLLISCRDTAPASELRVYGKINVDGIERTFLLQLPSKYDGTQKLPMVIGMHGGGGDAEQFEWSCGLSEKAEKEGFIVLYPEGVESTGLLKARTWNAGECCDYAVEKNIDDVNFLSQLIDYVSVNYAVDTKRIYATGHSNGGMMSYRLACELSTKIAAIAPNGSTLVLKNDCIPSRAVPILHMHSEKDEKVPYLGGPGVGVGTSNLDLLAVEKALDFWATKNKCAVKGQWKDQGNYSTLEWTNCENGVLIKYYLTKDGGHSWPGGKPGSIIGDPSSNAFIANDLMWDFFQDYRLN